MPSPSTQYVFSEAWTGLQKPLLQPKLTQFASTDFYTEHFSCVEFVPNLPNNTKCHLFGTHCILPSNLLHYALSRETCQSWKSTELRLVSIIHASSAFYPSVSAWVLKC